MNNKANMLKQFNETSTGRIPGITSMIMPKDLAIFVLRLNIGLYECNSLWDTVENCSFSSFVKEKESWDGKLSQNEGFETHPPFFRTIIESFIVSKQHIIVIKKLLKI